MHDHQRRESETEVRGRVDARRAAILVRPRCGHLRDRTQIYPELSGAGSALVAAIATTRFTRRMVARRSRSAEPDPLATYRDKRDFDRTAEPAGATPAASAGPLARFVVQRHRASRLHYDFRLEIGGVLVSWAVPKGPTLDPGVRRAAFAVEDHPLEYIDFEGVIPSAEYGGGDVIVWDAGTWQPHEAPDPARALADGELHLDLAGRKLRGRFVLVRTRTAASGKQEWLLLHKHDEHAVGGWNPEDHPASVLSGRTNDEVKADPDRLWRSDQPATRAAVSLKPAAGVPADPDALAALDTLASSDRWSIFGRELRVTDLDRVLSPAGPGVDAVTKRDLLRYAAQIAPVALPYLRARAVNLYRFPNGIGGKGYWQRQLPARAPDWLPRRQDKSAGSVSGRTQLVVDEPAALVWAANLGAVQWHASAAPIDAPDRPSYALIDLELDGTTGWDDLLALARLHCSAFDHLGLRAHPLLTGSRGLQLWIPVAAGPSFDDIRAWTDELSRTVAAAAPDLVGGKKPGSRRARTSNAAGLAPIAPYSPQAAAGAPVSAPVGWDELDDPGLSPDGFMIGEILARLAAKGDLFSGVLRHDQQLPALH